MSDEHSAENDRKLLGVGVRFIKFAAEIDAPDEDAFRDLGMRYPF